MKTALDIASLQVIYATRDMADFVVKTAKKEHVQAISLAKISSPSRSFLDELYIQTVRNNIALVDVPSETVPLLNIVKDSHKQNKVIAPDLEIQVSDKTFA